MGDKKKDNSEGKNTWSLNEASRNDASRKIDKKKTEEGEGPSFKIEISFSSFF